MRYILRRVYGSFGPFLFLLLAANAPGRANAWQAHFGGSGPGVLDQARAVATLSGGDVIVAGSLDNADTGLDFAVARLAATDGKAVWVAGFDSGLGVTDNEWALAVAVDAADDVVAAGGLEELPFFAVKLAGASGQELWRYETANGAAVAVTMSVAGDAVVGGPGRIVKLRGNDGVLIWEHTGHVANALALDASGDVYAVGHTLPTPDFSVLKLAGGDGAPLWLRSIDGPVSHFDAARHVALDADGDVFAVGELAVETEIFNGTVITRSETHFVKLAGDDGSEMWTRHDAALRTPTGGSALAVDAAGDAYLSGLRAGTLDGLVLKISGGDGSDVWSVDSLAGGVSIDAAPGLALSGGDVVVSAGLAPPPPGAAEWGFFALAQGSGGERWRRASGVKSFGFVAASLPALAVDSLGGVVGAGSAPRARGSDVSVVRLARALRGHKVRWSERDASHADADLLLKMRDGALFFASPDSGGDPRAHGAVLEIANSMSGEATSIALPAGGWTGRGAPAGAKGYDYKDRNGVYGPCRRAQLRDGQLLVQCRGDLGFTLDEPAQGALTFALRAGGQLSCAHFGGLIAVDAGDTAQAGRFQGALATPSAACAALP